MRYIFFIVLIAATIIFIAGIWRALKMSRKSVELIAKYEHDKNNPALIEEIYNAINGDFVLNKILRENCATIGDIKNLHGKLMQWGDFRKYNRYVPITSFFNRTALKYLLEHKNDDAKSLTEKMMNHFHI